MTSVRRLTVDHDVVSLWRRIKDAGSYLAVSSTRKKVKKTCQVYFTTICIPFSASFANSDMPIKLRITDISS